MVPLGRRRAGRVGAALQRGDQLAGPRRDADPQAPLGQADGEPAQQQQADEDARGDPASPLFSLKASRSIGAA